MFALLIFPRLIAQENQRVSGDFIIRLEMDHSPETFLSDLKQNSGIDKYLSTGRQLSKNLNIWLFHSSDSPDSDKSLLREIQQSNSVHTAQFNHQLQYRSNTPNDPEFEEQWQLLNDGSIGLENADIDADLAWDITTGGLSPQNDTIGVCVIDDGVDINHEDLLNNLWKNYAEIPNNEIDDDGNGYTDDFLGWNAYAENDNISSGGWHGTPVAGIIGAEGNNNTGVSGINWNIKLMIVKGGGTEADAIAAYEYPLEMRKRYNNSNGLEGAYVVATNTSWGTDGLQAEEAPLWCAMYDSLGTYGILNCGATANNEVDVDFLL